MEFISILSLPISGGDQNGEWRVAELDLGWLAGKSISVGIRCLPGSQSDPTADWLAISQFCIARSDEVALTLARTFPVLRARNELKHFSNVYRHEMYATVWTAPIEWSNLNVSAWSAFGLLE